MMRRRCTWVLAMVAVVGTGAVVDAQRPAASCTRDFDAAHAVITRNYAGYQDRLRENAALIAALTDSVRAAARQELSDSACTLLLQRWIAPFTARDHHLQLWQPRRARPESQRSGAEAPRLLPSLVFPDDSSAVLTLPSFDERYKPMIDSVVRAHWLRLVATPYLVVDVRENGGGATRSYASLLPLLYTDVIPRDGMDFWVSDDNLAMVRALAVDSTAPPGLRAEAARLLPGIERNPGRFYPIEDGDSLRFDSVYPLPRAIAILTGGGCASSCEQFVLDAMHSRKVIVMGVQPTAGFLDYGNVLTITLPDGIRRLAYATSRSRRLPARPMDHTGIVPQVVIPLNASDRVAYALRHLKERP